MTRGAVPAEMADAGRDEKDAAATLQARVAYVVSRFPKLSETFILFEMEGVARAGVPVELYSLVREQTTLMHGEASHWTVKGTFGTAMSLELLSAQVFWLRRRPGRYLTTWISALIANIRSPTFLLRTLYVVANAAMFGRRMLAQSITHVHAHYATHPGLAAWVAGRLTGLPYSMTVHAHDLYVDRTALAMKARDAAFIVAISDFNRVILEKQASDARVVVIHTGTDPEVFRPGSDAGSRPFTILAVGSLEPYKGHRYLVEACRLLASQGLDVRCDIVGEGPERPALEQTITEAGIASRCRLLGAATREQVRDAMARSDVFVLPSIRMSSGKMEGIPVVLMEAMAMERPVIASRLSGIPELVSECENGLLVPERDAERLAKAIARLHDDVDLRRRLGENGRRTIIRDFDLRTSARRLASLFSRRSDG